MPKVTVNGIQIAYSRRGQGAPLVLVHGYPLDHTIWDEVGSLLEGGFDIIAPDLRGFGQSDVVENQYTVTDMAKDIVGLLDNLEIEKASIVGHSMGGYVSLAFARAFPDRVTGLGLVASQALADTPEGKAGRYKTADEIMRSGVGPVAEAMSTKLTTDKRIQAQVQAIIARQKSAALAGALKAMAEREDSSPVLSSFKFPVVLVHGDKDALIPIQRAQEIKAEIPHAVLIELSGYGHMPMMEDPRSTAQSLKKLA